MSRAPRRLAGFVPLIALAACAGLGTTGGDRAVAPFPVGENLVGEACRVVPASEAGETAGHDVICGKWQEASARIRWAAGPPESALAQGPWRENLDALAVCDPATGVTLAGGIGALSLDCRLRRGGWPYQALAVPSADGTFLAHGIPSAEPAVERAVLVLSGRAQPLATDARGDLAREASRLEARVARARYSAGDLQRYRDLLRLGQYHNFRGDYAEAEKRYREALALQARSVATDSGGLAFALMHIALEISNQGRFAEAETFFAKAEALSPFSLEPTDEARLASYRALHLANQGKDEAALAEARKATESRRETARAFRPALLGSASDGHGGGRGDGTGGGRVPPPVVLTGAGSAAVGDVVQSRYIEAAMLARQGEAKEAEAALAEALLFFDADPKVPRRWLARIQLLQAEIAERAGDLPRAEILLRSTIQEENALFGGSRAEGQAHLALGRVLAAQNRPSDALAAFRAGFRVLNDTGGNLAPADLAPFFRLALAEGRRDPDARPSLNEEMFEVAQMTRGSVTARTMALVAARLAAGKGEAGRVVRELQDAHRERERMAEAFGRAQGDERTLAPQIEAMQKQWEAVNAKVRDLERQVQAAAPRYNQVLDKPASATALRAALAPGEALLQVLVGPDGTLAFLVDRDGVLVYPVGLSESEVRQAVARLRRPLEEGKTRAFDVAAAHALHEKLLGPGRERLGRVDHLITVPSGPLLSLPFGLLVTEPPPTDPPAEFSRVAWLARGPALSLAPSAQSFLNLRTARAAPRAPRALLGFGDFVPNRSVDSLLGLRGLPQGCRKDAEMVAGAPALPGTAKELQAVAGVLGGGGDATLVLGRDFSEGRIKTSALDDYRILYFATHGLLPHELNCWAEPSLLTSRAPGDGDDGFLTASEITELKLNSDLVVLSACNTGGPGEETGGESLSGLARAFFYAGARSLLVTHWRIPDEPTVRLMIGAFDGYAARGLTAAEALRASQIALIGDPRTAHPLNWAAFTLVGDGGARLSGPHPATTSARPEDGDGAV